MRIGEGQYVPVLKWREAEYQALYRLDEAQKSLVVPLIVVPPVEFDFETRKPRRSVQEHVDSFVERYRRKWNPRPAFIDLHPSLLSQDLPSIENVMTHIFRQIGESECNAIPVVGSAEGAVAPALEIATQNQRGIGLRMDLEQVLDGTLSDYEALLSSKLQLSEIDLIIDLRKPSNFQPIDSFAAALSLHTSEIKNLFEYRSFILVGTSIRLREIETPGGRLSRLEWQLYTELLKPEYKLGRLPTYGDYTIETPDFALGMDFRKISPAAKITYTVPDEWLVVKGRAYRSDTRQMKSLSEQIVKSRYYSGPDFSFGDRRIKDVAEGTSKPGHLGMMKQVGISHHLSFVLHELSSPVGRRNSP